MLKNAKFYEGFDLTASDGAIGTVKDVYFDDERWYVRYFVVDAGTWLEGRMVLISPGAITKPRYDDKTLGTALTQVQVRGSPSVTTDRPVSRQQELELNRYYAWPYYWTAPVLGMGLGGITAALQSPDVAPDEGRGAADPNHTSTEREMREAAKGDPHLRSAAAVRGYTIEAIDGAIGHVEDFVIEDKTWEVRYVLVDTRNWWPGKKVLVPRSAVRDIDWKSSKLHVDLTREAIKAGPELDEVSDEYSARLETYYRKYRESLVETSVAGGTPVAGKGN